MPEKPHTVEHAKSNYTVEPQDITLYPGTSKKFIGPPGEYYMAIFIEEGSVDASFKVVQNKNVTTGTVAKPEAPSIQKIESLVFPLYVENSTNSDSNEPKITIKFYYFQENSPFYTDRNSSYNSMRIYRDLTQIYYNIL